MIRELGSKLLHVLAVLFIVSIGITLMVDLVPGDPAIAIAGPDASDAQIQQIHERLGLDRPFLTRYWDWVTDLIKGDLGTSYKTGRPVTTEIIDRLPVSLEIALVSIVFALGLSICLGVVTGYRAGGKVDRAWTLMSSALVSVPAFVVALLLVFLFSVKLKDFPINFPATGWSDLSESIPANLWHACLPVATLTMTLLPIWSRQLRADIITTLREDYVLAARSRGVPTRRILLRHALRPSSFSLVTLGGVAVGSLMGGAVVVETLFAIPGVGQLLTNSLLSRDLPLVQGVVMFVALVYVLLNMSTDALYGLLDPRVRKRRALP